ncbi:hypothetical protein CsSME_00004174 [Camellia sinensis var. sinensis]
MVAFVAVSSPKSTVFQNPISSRVPNSNFLGGSSPLKALCLQVKPSKTKNRDVINLVLASSKTTTTTTAATGSGGGRFYLNFTGFPFPLGPFLNRCTIRTEVNFFFFFFFFFFTLSLFICIDTHIHTYRTLVLSSSLLIL